MNTKLSTNRKLRRMFSNILSIVVMLTMAFPVTGSAYAQDGTALPYGYHDGTEGNAQAGNCAAFGWAVDPDDRGRAVLVRVLSDDVQVAETPADDYGSDMEENEICPDGNCRFTVNLWEFISLGQPHQITVQAHDVETDQWVNLWETNRSITCNPQLEAFAWTDRLSLVDWPAQVAIDITIENPEYTGQFTPDGSSNWYDFFPGVDLQPGSTITATNGEITKTLIVSTLSATVDAATGSVTGFATPKRGFHMRTLGDTFTNPVDQDLTADQAGNWSADLSAFAPLEWFTRGEMWEMDDDGDVTYSIWHVHNELVEVWLSHNEIDAFDWPLNTELTFTVYDPATEQTYNYYAETGPVPWMDGTIALVTPENLALAPGMTVSVTDGNVSTSTVIQDIKIAHADTDNDLVYGSAPGGASLKLRSWEDNPAFRFFNAEQDGSWTVDYRIPSVNGTTVDVNFGDTFTLYMLEPDKDGTVWGWDVPNPRFSVFPEWESIEGWGWPLGADIYLTINDPLTADNPDFEQNGSVVVTPWNPNDRWVQFNLNGQYDIKAGDLVTLTDGLMARSHKVRNLDITAVSDAANTVEGTADPETELHVWPHGYNEIVLTSSGNGSWSVDFDSIGIDLLPGMDGRSAIRDAFGNETAVDWHIPNPWLTAFPEWDFVEGYEWSLGASVHLTIDDPTTENSFDFESDDNAEPSPWGDPRTYVSYEFAGAYDLKPGDVVTLSDGVTERTMVVQNLSITGVDTESNTVAGTADPGVVVNVWPHETGEQVVVTTDSTGNWQVDLTGAYDIVPGSGGRAEIRDDLYNGTAVDWNAPPPPPSPWLTVRANDDRVEAFDWEIGTTLTLEIDDPGIDGAPDYSTIGVVTGPTPWGDPRNYLSFNLAGVFDIQPGFEVSVGDETLTKTLSVTNLTITDIDLDGNVVYGQAAEGMRVDIWPCDNVMCANRHVNAESSSSWAVDFDVPGTEPNEQTTFDIKGGIVIDSGQCDEDGDCTNFSVAIPNPRFTVFPEWEWFDGLDWPDGATMAISVDGKPECSLERESWGGFFNGSFPQGCDIVFGDTVTFADGTTTRTHVVRNLYVMDVNVDENTVSGKADAGSTVYVWPHDGWFEPLQLTANDLGEWQADLDDKGYDIREDSVGRSEIRDEMGNATASDWHVVHPHFTVFPEWEWFDGNDWPNGAIVNITVANKPECETTKESWNYFFNGSFGEGCNLEVGDTVTFTDGEMIRTHTVQNLAITKANHEDDIVKGTADAGAEIHVWPHATGQEQLAITNPQGKWNVDFTGIYDLIPGDGGRAEIRDELGNATAIDWYIPDPHITIYPDAQVYDSGRWPDGAPVTLTVRGKPECTLTREAWGGYIVGNFPEGCSVTTGDKVTVTDGTIIRKHTVRNLAITKIDKEANTVTGIADTGANVHVWVWDTNNPDINVTAMDGRWFADFGALGVDLVDGMFIQAEILDENGNVTSVDLPVPNPRITASITEDWFYLADFIPGATLDLSIYENKDGNLIWSNDEMTADVNGFAWIDSEGWNLQPGNYLVVSDGNTKKDLIIEGFTFDVFNLSNGQLSGTAPSGRNVWVGIGWQDQDAWTMNVIADSGMWLADFGQPVPSDYWWVAAQIFDSDGDASELRPAQILP